jgi:acetyl esterase
MRSIFILITLNFILNVGFIFGESMSATLERMDPQSKIFLEQMNALDEPPMQTLPVEQVRQEMEQYAVPSSIELAKIDNISISGPEGQIPLRIYVPKGKGPFPVFVTIHGGGWVFGSLNTHDPFCRSIAEEAGVIVVSVDYRLAPEHKFPAGLNDCYAATLWVEKHIRQWGGDPSRLAIGGDSAGGNLTAAVTLLAKEKKFPSFKAQVLIYPVIQPCFDTPSYQKFAEGYLLSREEMKWFWDLYLNRPEDAQNPLASPILAKDLSGLPPALIIQAEFDPLYEEGLAYGKKLQAAHVSVTIKSYPTIHVFVNLRHHLDIGQKAVSDIAMFIKTELTK